MDADGDMLLGPASQEEPQPGSDGDLIIPMALDQEGDARGSRDSSLTASPQSRAFGAWLVTDGVGDALVRVVIGVAHMRWTITCSSPDSGSTHAAPSPSGGGRARESWGSLQYLVHEAFVLEDSVDLPRGFDLSHPLAQVRIRALCSTGSFVDGFSFDDVCDALGVSLSPVFLLSDSGVRAMSASVADILVLTMPLGQKIPVSSLPRGQPPLPLVRRLRKSWRPEQPGESMGPETEAAYWNRYTNTLLELPSSAEAFTVPTLPPKTRLGKTIVDKDPVKTLTGLDLCQYLRDVRFFTPAANASHTYDHGLAAPKRDTSKDCSRTHFERSKYILDVVDMQMDRRQHHADRIFDRIESIQLFTDSSPVTGEELQGMVVDMVYTDETTRRTILPGSSLCYGFFNAVAKCMALVWAIYLIAGTDYEDMCYFISKVIGMTTDNGTEIHVLEVPDVLDAFWAWLHGTPLSDCAIYVNYNRRLFYNALRVSGWNHNWSNLMKSVAQCCPRWPTVLQQMSTMVTFFRNKTYRKWLRRTLGPQGVDVTVLQHFRATMAKWRYQTIPFTMECLLVLRFICTLHIYPEMFNRAQDKPFMKEFFEAAKDTELWVFLEASYTIIFRPSEEARRWGMTCGCPHHIEMRREHHVKHVSCFWNGKNIATAWQHLEVEKQAVLDLGRTLSDADCEGSVVMKELMIVMLAKKHSGIDQFFGYLSLLPWVFGRADTVEGAAECMRQLREKPMDKQDPVTIDIANRIGGDIERRSRGEPVSPALAAQVKK